MKYEKAKLVVQNNLHLIGTINEKGFEVSEIIIVPSDATEREQFMRQYLFNRNAQKSIQAFAKSELEVWAIDTKHLFKANILFYSVIEQ